MSRASQKLAFLLKTDLLGLCKTVWFNLKYLPFNQAIHLPVFISSKVIVRNCYRGFYHGGGKTGDLCIGLYDWNYTCHTQSFLNIRGIIKTNGDGIHYIGPGATIITGQKAILEIGNNVRISYNVKLIAIKHIKIGDDNMWSHDIMVRDSDGHQILDCNGDIINRNRQVVFGNHVWIGSKATILKGSFVPKGCVIGARAVITKRLAKNDSIYAGNNRLLRQEIIWKKDSMEMIE